MNACHSLDSSRGVEAILNGLPALSTYATVEGMKHVGAEHGELVLVKRLMDSNHSSKK